MPNPSGVPKIFTFTFISVFAVLLFKLFFLQVVFGADYAQRAEQNRIKMIATPAVRGVIYDRQGKIMARNTPEGREYPLGPAAAHVLGYLGEADEQEVNSFAVSLGAQIGKIGIERAADKLLRGIDGGTIVELNSQGEVLRELSHQDSIAGQDLFLFIDADLQQTALDLLKDLKGAVIASKPSGEVLLLASSPSFDPNVFTLNKDEEKIKEILEDEAKPMFNRAIGGQYPPGSVFKIIPAVAGLETKVIEPYETIEDTGEIKIGEFRFGNWYFDQYGQKEGLVDMIKAIRRSNDIYFYKVGERLGISKLAAWARAFGLGKPTGISINGEVNGLVPDAEWKEKVKDEDWYLGDTYITAIGQGDLQTTPLQVNQMVGVIASDGKLCRPRLIKDNNKEKCEALPIDQQTIQVVKEGMKQACQPGGTGWPLFEFKVQNEDLKVDGVNFFQEASDSAQTVRIPVACKTGTAEFGDPEDRTHAWFSAFAPANDPEIIVTVLLEAAGQGSDEAAPVAKEILKKWFEDKKE